MTTLSTSGQNGLVISEDYIPVDAYQAIYHKLTKKTERISRQYKENYTITFDDICNLNQRIEQGLRHIRTIKASSCEITHATKDDYAHTYSSFDKFRISNLDVRECTSSFVYEFDFLVVIDSDIEQAKNVGQRYKLRLIFQQGFLDKDDLSVPYFMRGFLQFGKVYLNIDYADFSVAQHIESIVSAWRKGLPEKKPSKLYMFIMRNEGRINDLMPAATAMSALIGAAWYMASSDTLSVTHVSALAIAIALSYALRSVTGIATEFAFSTLKNFVPGPAIALTKGDKDKIADVAERLSSARKILGLIGVEIALAFLVGLGSAWFYGKFFEP